MTLRFIYESYLGRKSTINVSEFIFEGKARVSVERLGLDQNKRYRLKCECGGNDWTDNGRYFNEYECNVCGQFVTVYEDKYEVID